MGKMWGISCKAVACNQSLIVGSANLLRNLASWLGVHDRGHNREYVDDTQDGPRIGFLSSFREPTVSEREE